MRSLRPKAITFLFFIMAIALSGQNEDETIVIDISQIANGAERVEIQRYTGYENLLFRYLTLPYDVSANTSNQGRYFDIGYILLALFPIALLILTYRRKKLFYGFLVACSLYLMISFCYSYININEYGSINRADSEWTNVVNYHSLTTSEYVLSSVYNASNFLVSPIKKLAETISGQEDHITYPIISILLVFSLFFVIRLFHFSKKAQTLALISVVFFFLWLLLSGGIIWYGFLLIPMLGAFTFKLLEKGQKNMSMALRVWILVPLVTWCVLAYAARVSNIDSYTSIENRGKSIVDPKLVYFSTGFHDARESRDQIYKNISDAFDQINSNESLIYQIGTSFTFEISKNTTRIYQDNILNTYFAYYSSDKKIDFFNKVLKPSGFKYIILDLYTPTLDKTPEKSLTLKYQLFLDALYRDESVKLLTTDRLLEVKNKDQQIWRVYDLFGKKYLNDHDIKVIDHGSYAIYEIL